jgi:hypothetical protein
MLFEKEDVIDITDHKIIQILTKNIIHQMLKDNERVGKAKWHHHMFKMVVMGSEHELPFISFLNVHQVICSI